MLKAVRVNPGTVLVQAHPIESGAGKVSNAHPESWYVINDEPVLTAPVSCLRGPTRGGFSVWRHP